MRIILVTLTPIIHISLRGAWKHLVSMRGQQAQLEENLDEMMYLLYKYKSETKKGQNYDQEELIQHDKILQRLLESTYRIYNSISAFVDDASGTTTSTTTSYGTTTSASSPSVGTTVASAISGDRIILSPTSTTNNGQNSDSFRALARRDYATSGAYGRSGTGFLATSSFQPSRGGPDDNIVILEQQIQLLKSSVKALATR